MYFGLLKIIYEPFYRVKNILIPALTIYLFGICVFNFNTITIADTSVQIHLTEHNTKELSNGKKFYNIFGDEKTIIYAPNFYPVFSSTKYTLEKFIPFSPGDQEKYYRPNNKFTDIFSTIFKLLGLFYSSAFLFIISKRFFIKNK